MAEYLLRASAMEEIVSQVTELGGDVARMLKNSGITYKDDNTENSEKMISYPSFIKLLDFAVEETCIPHLMLLIARRQRERILGALWLSMSHEKDVRSALHTLVHYHHFHNQGAIVAVDIQGDLAFLTYTPKNAGEQNTSHFVELGTAIGLCIMRTLLGSQWTPKSQHFVHSAPADIKPYQQFYRCSLNYDQEFNGAVFDVSILDTQLNQSNPELLQILQSHLENSQTDTDIDLLTSLKTTIKKSMLDGDCSLNRVAGDLFLSRRSLQRQLNKQGTSYKALLESVRLDTATQYLRESRVPLSQLSDMLSYAGLTNFSRAFKRRFGVSPSQWRRKNSIINNL